VITNNFNVNIHFLNFRDFGKRVLYTGTQRYDCGHIFSITCFRNWVS